MKCIVHIGTEKTATSSFQRYMHTYRENARQAGVWYPRSLGNHWQRHLAFYAMPPSKPDDAFRMLGIKTEADHLSFPRKLETDFLEEFKEMQDCDTCLISSEHLHSRLLTKDDVFKVKSFLSPHFSEIKIVVSLRPQVDVLVSRASTAARGGRIIDRKYFEDANLTSTYFNYDKLLSMWEIVFGIESIVAVPFKRYPDLRKYLSHKEGIPIDGFGGMGNENSALDVQVIAMLNVIKKSGGDVRNLSEFLNKLPIREKIKISKSLAETIEDKCALGNDSLVDRYTSIVKSDLSSNLESMPLEDNLDLLEQPCMFSEALHDIFSQVNDLLSKNKRLRSEAKSAQ